MKLDRTTLAALARLNRHAVDRLRRQMETMTEPDIAFQAVDFDPGSGIVSMTLNNMPAGNPYSEIEFADGTDWRYSVLTIPARLPETTMAALSGRPVSDVVRQHLASPMIIRDATDGMTGVRLRCVLDREGFDPLELAAKPVDTGAVRAAARKWKGRKTDPVTASVLLAMPTNQALHAMAWLGGSNWDEKYPTTLRWKDVAGFAPRNTQSPIVLVRPTYGMEIETRCTTDGHGEVGHLRVEGPLVISTAALDVRPKASTLLGFNPAANGIETRIRRVASVDDVHRYVMARTVPFDMILHRLERALDDQRSATDHEEAEHA